MYDCIQLSNHPLEDIFKPRQPLRHGSANHFSSIDTGYLRYGKWCNNMGQAHIMQKKESVKG